MPALAPEKKLFATLSALLMALALGACTSHTVKTTAFDPLDVAKEEVPEEYLLDVGIVQFDAGLEDVELDEDTLVFPELRKAESRFIAVTLTEALQRSSGWGAVRVVPNAGTAVDVVVDGRILKSDGETLTVEVSVRDSRGGLWFTREYTEVASRYAYDPKHPTEGDAFQGLYNRIANDLLRHRRSLSKQQIANLRTISEIRFARDFVPDAFDRHLVRDGAGMYHLKSLPAESDPTLGRIRRIRERDYLFIDTLQDHYGTFVKSMEMPYKQWRALSYDEVVEMRELRRKARNNTIMGAAAIIGGIAAAGSGSGAARQAGNVAVAGGGYMVKAGFDRRAEAKMHIEALQELGDSMEAEVEPRIVELEDRTITLSGSVETQYRQWRDILQEMYEAETGGMQ
ncbi:hypothetical protein [Biformimicrobium ophioploci]|uniref:Lipoprotein n=1 Tax=Biformimicrobium ophioploci TaxID=3036711 RepID=A0ABQ6LYR5_9GAMM|nr:hypothetical protein [Microbulbifer sp. NKW57]GMG87177.1 hypothetical protein MNKW57_14980 [Microbulbifer sp. NKW57]